MAERADYAIKLRSSGDAMVGKTCLMLRWFEDAFNSAELVTIGADTRTKIVDIGGKKVNIQMLDTGGQEKFRFATPPPCLLPPPHAKCSPICLF
jgi:small GTP-binding protein